MLGIELSVGLILVLWGADLLITSSIAIGKKFNVSELLIGILVIGFGTSLSELFVSIDAVLKDASELTLGNIIGSNIANILLVLGVCGLYTKIIIPKVSKSDNLYHLFISLLFLFVCFFLKLNIFWGILFIVLFIFYLYKIIKLSKYENSENTKLDDGFITRKVFSKPISIGIPVILLSIIITLYGADLTVISAIEISRIFNVSESIVGLTLIAFGTSLPEIAAGIASVRKRKFELIVGNIMGSNLYNILLIIGTSSLFKQFKYQLENIYYDLIFMNLCVFLFTIFVYKKISINIVVSLIFLVVYAIYIFYLFQKIF